MSSHKPIQRIAIVGTGCYRRKLGSLLSFARIQCGRNRSRAGRGGKASGNMWRKHGGCLRNMG